MQETSWQVLREFGSSEQCCMGWEECTGVRMNVQGRCQHGHAGLQHGLRRVCDNLKEHSEDWGGCMSAR